jgi:hypothetical protein
MPDSRRFRLFEPPGGLDNRQDAFSLSDVATCSSRRRASVFRLGSWGDGVGLTVGSDPLLVGVEGNQQAA